MCAVPPGASGYNVLCASRTWAFEAHRALADWGVMNGKAPDLHMLNVIVADMPASLDFYLCWSKTRLPVLAWTFTRRAGTR